MAINPHKTMNIMKLQEKGVVIKEAEILGTKNINNLFACLVKSLIKRKGSSFG